MMDVFDKKKHVIEKMVLSYNIEKGHVHLDT